jgi:hypothetical protein
MPTRSGVGALPPLCSAAEELGMVGIVRVLDESGAVEGVSTMAVPRVGARVEREDVRARGGGGSVQIPISFPVPITIMVSIAIMISQPISRARPIAARDMIRVMASMIVLRLFLNR